jgi:hypothetical protein
MEACRLVPFTSTLFRGMRPTEVCVPDRLRRNVMDQPVESAGTIAFLSRFGPGALHLNRKTRRSGRDLRAGLLCMSGVLVAARKKKSENVLEMRQSASNVQVAHAGRLAPSDVSGTPAGQPARRDEVARQGVAPRRPDPQGNGASRRTIKADLGAGAKGPRAADETCSRAMPRRKE